MRVLWEEKKKNKQKRDTIEKVKKVRDPGQ